ncbi:MAG: hypothetical protein R3330_17220, partial [Saprospiraceae bacterium]|nr:hypothetical protein [Saprospiraceae bacterium]
LYYYDQAGNLVQTVPPEGVNPVDDSDFMDGVWNGTEPEHDTTLITRYQYNSAEQIVHQRTPEAGRTEFHYDRAQRLRFSQNARQSPGSDYAYTKYDAQSRIIEVGQLENYPLTASDIADQSFPTSSETLTDVVRTTYDETTPPSGVPSENTRGRVAKVENDHVATYYDYDAHGNVRELTHILPQLQDSVVSVAYTYDADNRIQRVFTSDDGYVFDEDARYFYYLHGPLARVELGEDKVQGMDYFYTLQGWIKGVNMSGGMASEDQGLDGHIDSTNVHRYFGRDTMTYTLGYHASDYDPIGSLSLSSAIANSWTGFSSDILESQSTEGLFNGNISQMLTDNGMGLQGMAYQYDALHRIRQGRSYDWSSSWSASNDFDVDMRYDANGHLDSL